ncbi:Nitroreductase [Rhizobium sp. RU35A]|uniref:Nitroreductase family protein n=1 Tax=Rhizobium straminoryzae TaxID=1387186 RepID=A0A549T9Q5_9HYPH|nr:MULTISPECIES: nitroreductase family protein [Rhizobium]TRL38586.1 nitroreductase family protein [Rhizobium straminoryzae]SIP91754.1 Nitroreductase [Rhizobium sp. RU35A]
MTANTRKADHPVAEVFTGRWSPRAFTDATISEQELLGLLEAARWAPSAFNAQPWRFIYALRGDAVWQPILGALLPFNQSWAEKASALVIVASATRFTAPGKTEPSDNGSHTFDAGTAWGYLALQAHMAGWASHAMAGFDKQAMAKAVNLPEGHVLHAAVAIGKQGDASLLPEALQAREVASPRLPLSETVVHGVFKD